MMIAMLNNLPTHFRIAALARKNNISFTIPGLKRSKAMGASIVRSGNVLSFGTNIPNKTHPEYKTHPYSKSIHAELSAIIHAAADVGGADMYIYREDALGRPALAHPCPHCMDILRLAGIRRVFYTVNGGYGVMDIK